MGLLDERKVISREKRTSAITAYYGRNETLIDDLNVSEIRQRIRTFSQGSKDEITEVLNVLTTIKEAVVIVHGAIGCSAAILGYSYDNKESNVWYSTHLNERDTIMGGDEKLRETVLRAYKEQRPKVIFIVGTPVVAINNDDINSVILELEEELNVKIISIYSDGFKSKAAINGIDIVLHALGRYLIKKKEKQNNLVNLIAVTENKKSIKEGRRLLERLGLEVNVIPRFSSIAEIERAGSATVSIAFDGDKADVLLQGLKEAAEVPYIKTASPIGLSATSEWLTRIGEVLFIEDKVEALIAEEEKRVEKYSLRHPLNGSKIYIDLDTSLAISFVGLIEELGGELSGVTFSHIDSLNKESLTKLHKNVPVRIADGQPFELVNIFSKSTADYYISSNGKTGFIAALGILPISTENKTIYGYEGVIEFIQSIKRAKRSRGFGEFLKNNAETPYKDTWLNKSTNWYIKQEVK